MIYEDNAPVWICEFGHKELTWKKFKDEYLKLHEKKENWLEKKHKVSCILGWFCYLYKKKFKIDYIFVPTNINPFKSLECETAQVLLATFDNNALHVRDYLKWLINKELRADITSIGYIKTAGIIRKYMLFKESEKTKTRTTPLPQDFLNWCKLETKVMENYPLNDFADLLSLEKQVRAYNLVGEENKVLEQAEKLGLIHDGKIKQ